MSDPISLSEYKQKKQKAIEDFDFEVPVTLAFMRTFGGEMMKRFADLYTKIDKMLSWFEMIDARLKQLDEKLERSFGETRSRTTGKNRYH